MLNRGLVFAPLSRDYKMLFKMSTFALVLVYAATLPSAFGEGLEKVRLPNNSRDGRLPASLSGQRRVGRNRQAPNATAVVFIVLDAARADHFSCYGYRKRTTPRMDGIGLKGVLFLNNFSPATATVYSIPRIFLSRYFCIDPLRPDDFPQYAVRRETPMSVFGKSDDEQISLVKILSHNGYRTALFSGRAGLSKVLARKHKFDESYSFHTSPHHPSDEEIISAVTSWIRKNKKRKFFLYCHIMSPHRPYPAKKEDKEFLAGEDAACVEAVRQKLHKAGRRPPVSEWSGKDLRIFRGLYDGNLRHTDKRIGALYDRLKELGLENNTLLIITADHGENLGEHNNLEHEGPPWDSVTHIPLIMVYPPVIPPGVRVNGFTESIDIMPTILDICGIKIPRDKSMDGVSLLPLLPDPSLHPGGVTPLRRDGREAVFTYESIRTARYKYIVPGRTGGPDFLYDLKNDPGETKNIAMQKPLIKEKLKARFEKAMRPYRARFEKSRRENPPDFPFFFGIRDFEIIPKDAFEGPGKPWRLLTRGRISALPENGPLPAISLSARVPNGVYGVSILLESPHEISSPQKFGFRFRFDTGEGGPELRSVLPGRIDPVGTRAKKQEPRSYYLHLGKTRVKREKFRVGISFNPPGREPYTIHHVKFLPAGIQEEKTREDDEEVRRKIESLKALGYAQ